MKGIIAGAGSWIAGYVLTTLLVLNCIEGSELGEIAENAGDGGSGIDFVGWVFFNAHFVDTVVAADFLGIGGSITATFIGRDGFTQLPYLVPVALLVGAGLAVGRSRGITETAEGASTGLFVLSPSLLLSAIGAVVFRVSTAALGGSFNGQPELLPTILLAGLVLPAICGPIGDIIAANTGSEN